MKTFIYGLLLISITPAYFAQNGNDWDLQKCVDYAQKHNISLKQSEITTQINKNNTLQSEAAILPTINLGAQHTYNFGRTIDRYTNTFANSRVLSQNFYASSNVVLWSGLAQYNNIQATKYQYLASTENYLQLRNDLALNVATTYINVIFSEEILHIAKTSYSLTLEQLARTEKLADAGTVAKSAVYDVKAQLANDDVTVTNADNNYQIAMLTLKQLLNIDTLNSFAIVRPDLDIMNNELASTSVQNIYETALKNQHSIKSSNYTLLASERNLNTAKGKVSPTLSITGSVGTGTSELNKKVISSRYNGYDPVAGTIDGSNIIVYQPHVDVVTEKTPFADQFKDNVNKSIGFTLNVPIFNGLQTLTGVKNAKLNVLNAKYSQDLVHQNLYKTIAQAYANSKAALNKFNANKASVNASEQSFMYAQQKYTVGAISTFDYNSAKTRLMNAQSNLVQAKYDYVFKLKVLDYYQGKELKF